MSGTLQPLTMHTDLLGITGLQNSYRSDFPEKNRLNIITPELTTKFTERNEKQFDKIAAYINTCTENIKGNIAAFFPSYYLRDEIMNRIRTDKILFIEEQNSTKKEKTALYESFITSFKQGALLLGVQAGSYGEGADFPGQALSAVLIVGLSLEKPTLKTQALIDYYNEKFGKGWEYAYTYPAVLRAMQTAGRCIRSREDKGICIFMDKRFMWPNYRNMFTFPTNIAYKQEDMKKMINNFNKIQ
jgi:DNA excision repair protein ERCC-2